MSIQVNSNILKRISDLELEFSKINKVIEKEKNLSEFAKKQLKISRATPNKNLIDLDDL